jgi:hypothetical protein
VRRGIGFGTDMFLSAVHFVLGATYVSSLCILIFFTVDLLREVRDEAGVVRVAHTHLHGEFVVGGVALIVF